MLVPTEIDFLIQGFFPIFSNVKKKDRRSKDHGDAVDQLKNLFAGTHEAVAGPPGGTLVKRWGKPWDEHGLENPEWLPIEI